MTPGFTARVIAERKAQGLPPTVTDSSALRQLASLLRPRRPKVKV